jgi:glycosyltransferase involved in cell wall biosynthesis
MRILHITPFFFEGLNYQEEALCEQQSLEGHDVHIIRPKTRSKAERYATKNIKAFEIKRSYTVHEVKNILFRNRVLFFRLARKICNINPEIIHCHNYLHPHSVQVSRISKKYSYPVIFDEHASDFNTKTSWLINWHYRLIHKIISCYCHNTKIIFTSEDNLNFWDLVFKHRNKNMGLIRLGFDSSIFRTSDKIIEKDTLNFVHAGSNIKQSKELERICEIAVRLPEKKIVLEVIGSIDNEYKKNLVSKTSGYSNIKITFTALLPKKELAAHFQAADIAFWPGDISIGFLQAIACGCLGLTPIRSGYQKSLENNSACLSFGDDDQHDSYKVLEILKSKETLEKAKHLAALNIRQSHSWSEISKQYLEEYKNRMEKYD